MLFSLCELFDQVEEFGHCEGVAEGLNTVEGFRAKLVTASVGICFRDEETVEVTDEIPEEPGEVFACGGLFLNKAQCIWDLMEDEVCTEAGDGLQSGEPENSEDVVFLDCLAAEGDELIEHGFCITHSAVGASGECFCSCLGELDGLLGGDGQEVRRDEGCRDALEIEALATAEDSSGNLLGVGGGKDEFDVGGGFLEGFEEGVERGVGEHVDLVHDVDLVLATRRRVLDVLDDDLPYFIDSRVGGGVEFEHIETGARCNLPAGVAFAAWRSGGARGAVQCLG